VLINGTRVCQEKMPGHRGDWERGWEFPGGRLELPDGGEGDITADSGDLDGKELGRGNAGTRKSGDVIIAVIGTFVDTEVHGGGEAGTGGTGNKYLLPLHWQNKGA